MPSPGSVGDSKREGQYDEVNLTSLWIGGGFGCHSICSCSIAYVLVRLLDCKIQYRLVYMFHLTLDFALI